MTALSKRSQEGYLLIDQRASGGATLESATITCAHCNFVVILNPLRTRARGYCRRCDHYVCDKFECNRECHPVTQQLDDLETQILKGLHHG